jgi:hypothetical protein
MGEMRRLTGALVIGLAAMAWPRAALARDIGYDPLAPAPRPEEPPAEVPGEPVGRAAEVGAAPRGAANPEPLGERASTAQRRHWYGWQTLLVDGGVLVGTLAISSGGRSGSLALPVITTGFIVGGPIVHAAHGQATSALGSLVLRASGPLLIAAAFASDTTSGGGGYAAPLGLLVLGVLAIPAAIAIDSAVIAREDVPLEKATSRRPMIGAAPWVDMNRRAAGLSLTLGL